MADTLTVKRWNADTALTCSKYVTTRDEDFGEPDIIKKIYGIYFTYKSSVNAAATTMIKYATNGSSSFINTSITAGTIASSSAWDVGVVKFSTPITCQSIKYKFTHTTGTFDLLDYGIEARPIYKRVS